MGTTEPKWSFKEKRTARNWYWWLWLSPLVVAASFFGLVILAYFGGAQTSTGVILGTVMSTAVWHLVLLVPALSKKSAFVRWHGRQALLLAGVLTAMLPFALGSLLASLDRGLTVFVVLVLAVLLAIWFFGTLLSQRQAARGDCSLMRWLGRGGAGRRQPQRH